MLSHKSCIVARFYGSMVVHDGEQAVPEGAADTRLESQTTRTGDRDGVWLPVVGQGTVHLRPETLLRRHKGSHVEELRELNPSRDLLVFAGRVLEALCSEVSRDDSRVRQRDMRARDAGADL